MSQARFLDLEQYLIINTKIFFAIHSQLKAHADNA
jgi:hypothetical protein